MSQELAETSHTGECHRLVVSGSSSIKKTEINNSVAASTRRRELDPRAPGPQKWVRLIYYIYVMPTLLGQLLAEQGNTRFAWKTHSSRIANLSVSLILCWLMRGFCTLIQFMIWLVPCARWCSISLKRIFSRSLAARLHEVFSGINVVAGA